MKLEDMKDVDVNTLIAQKVFEKEVVQWDNSPNREVVVGDFVYEDLPDYCNGHHTENIFGKLSMDGFNAQMEVEKETATCSVWKGRGKSKVEVCRAIDISSPDEGRFGIFRLMCETTLEALGIDPKQDTEVTVKDGYEQQMEDHEENRGEEEEGDKVIGS